MKPINDSQDIAGYILKKLADINNTKVSLEFIIKLNEITRNPDVEINEVAKLIEREPNMCAQLMRLSNSPYFSRGQRIGSVNQAIMRLGLDTVKRLIVSFGIFDLTSDYITFPFFNETAFLKSNIAGAMISEEVAKRAGLADKDDIYICTLLRDFGVFILKQYFPDLFHKIHSTMQEKKWPFRLSCLMVCGIDHHHISTQLFSQWKLPITIASVFNNDETMRKKQVLIERVYGHVDFILKKCDYAQWDPYLIPSERSVNLFAKNEDFDIAVKRKIAEADNFITQLTKALEEESVAIC